MSKGDHKTGIHIVGAGLGGLTAAWYLSKHRHDVDITVYEASWVPGGKAASGRAHPPPGGDAPHFIEEHGLHMLFGTYHETWQMLADCYETIDRPVDYALRRIEQAFTPQRRVVFDEPGGTGRQHWVFCPEEHNGSPWDPSGPQPNDDMQLLRSLIPGVELTSRTLQTTAVRMRGPAAHPLRAKRTAAFAALEAARAGRRPVVHEETMGAMRHWTRHTAGACCARRSRCSRPPAAQPPLAQLLRLATSARRAEELLDLGFAILDGTRRLMETCNCPPSQCICFDRLNDLDLRDWLGQNGWQSGNDAIVRGFYAGLFARPGELAAGVGLRVILRVLFDYRGAMVYRMESGMGEAVVAPLYKTLKSRGVKFKFMHRLTAIETSQDRIAGLQFEDLGSLPDTYEPLETADSLQGKIQYFSHVPTKIKGVRAAPAGEFHQMHRRWTTHGVEKSISLDARDHVILAVPPKALNEVGGMPVADANWQRFLSGAIATLSRRVTSAQIWRRVAPETNRNPIAGAVAAGQAEPFNVWADMSHLLSREGASHPATELTFVCGLGQATSPSTQAKEIHSVAAEVDGWLSAQASFMLGRDGDEVHRYIAASLEPSDEYVLSAPKTIASRIAPGDSGIANLSLAGDWVKNGLNCGSVESAVTGGIIAAKSIP